MKYSTILLCLLGLTAGVWSQCVQDYECGNVPYTICDGGVNDCESTVPGIGVDMANNQIYFAQVCRVDFDQFPYVPLFFLFFIQFIGTTLTFTLEILLSKRLVLLEAFPQ